MELITQNQESSIKNQESTTTLFSKMEHTTKNQESKQSHYGHYSHGEEEAQSSLSLEGIQEIQEMKCGSSRNEFLDSNKNKNGDHHQECSGSERLKRHRSEVAGSVWIPEIWGQEELLKDWIDCSAFEASLVPQNIMSARSALVQEGRRSNSSSLRIENRC
ncbi:Protein BIC1 [Euphorbia peplus]|nr:Protein BIC1 [Euphorbia peplus]